MDFLKSWIELVRDFRSGQFWWSLAVLVTFADWYLLVRFDTGVLGWMETVPALAEVQFSGSRAAEVLYFATVAALSWFYLLPVLVVPLWKKVMFEVNWRLSADYRDSPSRKAGWRYLPGVKQWAALVGNPVLYAYCEARRREIAERSHQLTCALGIALFSFLAVFADVKGGSSLAGMAMAAWRALAEGWQFVLVVAALPGGIFLGIILSARWERFDPYIQLPDDFGDMDL